MLKSVCIDSFSRTLMASQPHLDIFLSLVLNHSFFLVVKEGTAISFLSFQQNVIWSEYLFDFWTQESTKAN